MAGHHPFKKLLDKMTPERRAEIDRRVQEDLQEMLLVELRKLMGMTQTNLAEELGVSQANVSQLENASDMQISTLQRIVQAARRRVGDRREAAHRPGVSDACSFIRLRKFFYNL